MVKKIRVLRKKIAREDGQIFIVTLVFLLLGSIIMAPLLSFMTGGLKTGMMYEGKTRELYAADAGIEDALWQVKYGHINSFTSPTAYSTYDYTTAWPYSLSQQVNVKDVDVTIQNVWIPLNVAVPDKATARNIVEANKLVVTGSTVETGIVVSPGVTVSKYRIKVQYYPGAGEDLEVSTLGIWLPRGFSYYTDATYKSNLEDIGQPYYSTPATMPWAGNEVELWSYATPVDFTSFPGVSQLDNPMTAEITFYYEPPPGQPDKKVDAVGWITTSGVSDIPFAWDADIGVYKMVSVSGSTTIESYIAKAEVRKLESAMAGDYYATGNTLMRDTNHDANGIRDVLDASSSADVTSIPNDADTAAAFLYWSAWRAEGSKTTVFSDSCSDFTKWDTSGSSGGNQTRVPTADGDTSGTWNTSPCWDDVDETTPNDTDYMTGTTDSGGYKLFTFSPFSIPAGSTITDLTVYVRAKDVSSDTNNIRPSIKVNGTRYNTTAPSNNPGSSFTTYSYSYTTNPSTFSAWTVDDINGTGTRPLQQFGVYSSDLNPDIQVSMVYAKVNYNYSSGCWSLSSGRFRGHGSGSATTEDRTITLKNSLNLSSYTPGSVAVSWQQSEEGDLETGDGLDFSFSDNGGATWSSNYPAFRDDIGTSPIPSSYPIPAQYLTANFKMRFYLVSCSDSGEYVYIDNIIVSVMPPDTSIVFKIDGNQVYYDAGGHPQQGVQPLTADKVQVLPNFDSSGDPNGFSYACYADVTALIREFSVLGPNLNHPGNATYLVGSVAGDVGNQWSYAAWSLIIVYTSAETQGHQLYLYDDFQYAHNDTNIDFDKDGQPGGLIQGFIVPAPIPGEVNSAKLTVFVGEGDECWSGDSLEFNGAALSNAESPSDNVWNSRSPDVSSDGIDIDTFNITWASGLLSQGDTSAQIGLPTQDDSWNLVYIILSFRSATTSGGALSYLIR